MRDFIPVSSLLDKKMLDRRGEFVGWVRELLIDLAAGRIEYVRIELSRASDPREVVVPWSAVLRNSEAKDALKIAARKSTLELLSEI